MNHEVTNAMSQLSYALDCLQQCDEYDFENDDADDLDTLHNELEALYFKSDETIYDLKERIAYLKAERRREEEESDYDSESKHRSDLNSWWDSQRI